MSEEIRTEVRANEIGGMDTAEGMGLLFDRARAVSNLSVGNDGLCKGLGRVVSRGLQDGVVACAEGCALKVTLEGDSLAPEEDHVVAACSRAVSDDESCIACQHKTLERIGLRLKEMPAAERKAQLRLRQAQDAVQEAAHELQEVFKIK